MYNRMDTTYELYVGDDDDDDCFTFFMMMLLTFCVCCVRKAFGGVGHLSIPKIQKKSKMVSETSFLFSKERDG